MDGSVTLFDIELLWSIVECTSFAVSLRSVVGSRLVESLKPVATEIYGEAGLSGEKR